MPAYHFMLWNDKIDARLIHLIFEQGLSHSQAAAILQDEFRMACTRNSCIGRVARLRARGLLKKPVVQPHQLIPVLVPVKKVVNGPSVPEAPELERGSDRKVSARRKVRPKTSQSKFKQEGVTILEVVKLEVPPVSTSLLDIPESRYQCRWIEGEGAERRWCCAQTAFRQRKGEVYSLPYCSAHAQRCYK